MSGDFAVRLLMMMMMMILVVVVVLRLLGREGEVEDRVIDLHHHDLMFLFWIPLDSY